MIASSILALLVSAFFSAAEVAIFSIRGPTLKSLLNRNESKGGWIEEILSQPRKFLVVILLGNALSNGIFVLGITLFFQIFHSSSHFWLPILLATGLLLLFGELIPKAVARRKATTIALYTVGGLRALEKGMRPIAGFVDRLVQHWVTRFSPSSMPHVQGLTEDEYVTMLDIGTREGTLRPWEKRLIERTLQLSDRNLRELMTPRGEICFLDIDLDLKEMKARASSMRHRRLPICSESLDSIVGILNVKRFLLEENVDMISCIEPPAFVPETISALELFKNFLRGPQRMAMVVDEFGGVEGLITLEDIVEEVFGEVYDEYDPTAPSWEEIEPSTFIVSGSAHLPTVSEWLGVNLESDGMDTLGGWLTDKIGALPRSGDRYSFHGYSFQVEKMQRLHVGTVLVRDERRKK